MNPRHKARTKNPPIKGDSRSSGVMILYLPIGVAKCRVNASVRFAATEQYSQFSMFLPSRKPHFLIEA